jgi:hypothetical protein
MTLEVAQAQAEAMKVLIDYPFLEFVIAAGIVSILTNLVGTFRVLPHDENLKISIERQNFLCPGEDK